MIVYCCADLIFATKVRSTADALGLPSRPARDAGMLLARLDRVDDGKVNDAVRLVVVDLEREGGIDLIRLAATHDSTAGDARPEVVAFGPHVMTEALRAAQEAGAGTVMTRGAFTAQLPAILQQAGPSNASV